MEDSFKATLFLLAFKDDRSLVSIEQEWLLLRVLFHLKLLALFSIISNMLVGFSLREVDDLKKLDK